jgi:hypothetical protein
MKLSELLATGFLCGLIAAVVIIATVFALDRFGPTPHDALIANVVGGATVLILIFVAVRKARSRHN